MSEEQIREAANEYMETPPVSAAIRCGDVEDLVSHIKVAYANGLRDALEAFEGKNNLKQNYYGRIDSKYFRWARILFYGPLRYSSDRKYE